MVVTGLAQATPTLGQVTMLDDRRPPTVWPESSSYHTRGKGHDKCDGHHGGGTAPGIPQWVREFGTPGNDFAGGVAVDPSGNALIVGGSNGFTDAFVRKYDSNGNVLWSREFAVGYGGAQFVGTDHLGNIYVVGGAMASVSGQPYAGATDVFVCKYSPSGDELWTAEFGSADYDGAFSAAFDSDGNTYVGGYGLGGFEDGFVAKISSAGTILWLTQIGTSGGNYVNNVTFDSSGGAYATGGLNNDGFVSRLDGTTGRVVWQVILPNQVIFTEGTDLAVSRSGVYVAYELAGNTSSDAVIRKYELDGTELWSNVIPGGYFSNAGSRNLLVNAVGQVYAMCTTGNGQGAVRKLNPGGVEQWTVTLGGPGGLLPLGGALDRAGNLWLHGQISIGGGDLAVVELDPSGNTLLAAQYGSPGFDFASASSIAIGCGGEIYAASTVQGPVGGQPYLGVQDCLLAKFRWRSKVDDAHSDAESGSP